MTRADDYFAELKEQEMEEFGDLSQQVGDCLLSLGDHARALTFFLPLLHTAAFNTVDVWVSLGKCYHELGRLPEAADTYRSVMEHLAPGAPQFYPVSLALADALKRLGRHDEAKEILLACDRAMAEEGGGGAGGAAAAGAEGAGAAAGAGAVVSLLQRAEVLRDLHLEYEFINLVYPALFR
jgi:tetratricopeptide (TPR) repeat protein